MSATFADALCQSSSLRLLTDTELDGGEAAKGIQSDFASGKFIGISGADAQKAAQLRSLLGIGDRLGAVDVDGTEVFGLKKAGRSVEQIVIPRPVLPAGVAEDTLDGAHRAAEAIKMIESVEQPTVAARAAVGGGDPVDLFNQAHQYTSKVQWCLPVTNSSKQAINCYYQLISKAQAVWVKDAAGSTYDYYFLIQYGVFAPGPGYIEDTTARQGWYVTYYNLNAYPKDYLGNSGILMAQNSPGTTQGQENVTSSISETTGISIGFFGDQGTANINASVTIGTSKSYSIPDVKVANSSNSQGNNAEWSFEIPYVEGTLSFSAPVTMATNTFQPVNMMLWQADDTIRQDIEKKTKPKDTAAIGFKTDFSMQYVYSYHDDGPQYDTYQPTPQSISFSVPLPPQQKPPS